jgi:hypothetical protein
MGKLTSAERSHAAMIGTEVALLATDLDCWHFPTTIRRIVDLAVALYQTRLATAHTKCRHPIVHVEQPHCSFACCIRKGFAAVTIQETYSLWRWEQNFVAFPSASTNARFRHSGMVHMLSRGGGLGRRPLLLNSPAHRRPQKSCAKKKVSSVHQNRGKTHPAHSQCTQASHCSSLIMSVYYQML